MRDFDFIKIFCISFVWSYLFCIPLFVNDVDNSAYIFCEKALFIFAITIPFDIRDREVDRSVHLRTFGTVLGLKSALTFSLVCLLVCSGIVLVLHIEKIYSFADLVVLVLSYIATASLISNSKSKSEFFYLAYLDGMIGLQGVFIIIVS